MNETVRVIRKVTAVGIWINAVLVALKLFFGYRGDSDALVADGYHSMSDFITDFIVIAFVAASYKKADPGHPYGHGKFCYRHTISYGRKLGSSALIANAWHHRSDAISSIATLVGVAFSIFMGAGWRIMDPIASMVIAVMICISAVKVREGHEIATNVETRLEKEFGPDLIIYVHTEPQEP